LHHHLLLQELLLLLEERLLLRLLVVLLLLRFRDEVMATNRTRLNPDCMIRVRKIHTKMIYQPQNKPSNDSQAHTNLKVIAEMRKSKNGDGATINCKNERNKIVRYQNIRETS